MEPGCRRRFLGGIVLGVARSPVGGVRQARSWCGPSIKPSTWVPWEVKRRDDEHDAPRARALPAQRSPRSLHPIDVEDLPAGPYRSVAIIASPAVRPARRPAGPRVVAACVLAGSIVAGVLGASGEQIVGALGVVLTTGAAVMLTVGNHRRARAVHRLAALPFPIEHDRKSAIDTHSVHRSAIRSVAVRLVSVLDRPALECVARDAEARAPGLAVLTDGNTIVITSWPWGGGDLLLLEDLLSTWACALHAEHPIATVTVTWAPGGPPSSL